MNIQRVKQIHNYYRLVLFAFMGVLAATYLFPVVVPEVYAVFKGLFELDINYIFDGQPFEPSDFANVKIK